MADQSFLAASAQCTGVVGTSGMRRGVLWILFSRSLSPPLCVTSHKGGGFPAIQGGFGGGVRRAGGDEVFVY